MVPSSAGHVLVTGGAGFLGSALIPRLLERGDWVTVIDRLFYGAEASMAHINHPRFKLLTLDVCAPAVKQAVVQRLTESNAPPIQAVLHLAAAVGHEVCQNLGEDETLRINVTGAEKMFLLADELEAGRFIFASTCSVYGRTQSQVVDEYGPLQPVSLYGRSKVEAEKALQQLKADLNSELLIFRLASVFGLSPRMRFDVLVNQLVGQAQAEEKVVIFHPDHWRPFIHIQDVVEAFMAAIDAEKLEGEPRVVNLGSEKNCVTKQMLAEELKLLAPKVKVEISNQSLNPPDQDVRLEFSRLHTKLGFQPLRTISQGMQEVFSALQQGWFAHSPGHYQNRLSASL